MLSIQEFGAELLETNDLDPVYCALYDTQLPPSQLLRLILAYSCFYHLGVAAKISELQGKKYWDKLEEAAVNEGLKWPRNSERRHFRGAAAIKAVKSLREKYRNPEFVVQYWFEKETPATTFYDIYDRVTKEVNFGPWAAFKLADLAERLGWPVVFSNCELNIYKDPKQGAALYKFGDYNHSITVAELKEVVTELVEYFSKYLAPPRYERSVNVQEIETILCRFKTYSKGHYWLGEDTEKIKQDLRGCGRTAELLLKHMPEGLTYEESKKIGGVPLRLQKRSNANCGRVK